MFNTPPICELISPSVACFPRRSSLMPARSPNPHNQLDSSTHGLKARHPAGLLLYPYKYGLQSKSKSAIVRLMKQKLEKKMAPLPGGGKAKNESPYNLG